MKPLLVATVIIVCALGFVYLSDWSDADVPDIQLYEVKPTQTDEGFALINNSGGAIDLNGYKVSNGTGTVSFTSSLELGPGETLIVVQYDDESPYFLSRDGHPHKKWGVSGIAGDNFELDDNGFALYLYNSSNNIVDAFCYGNAAGDSVHWTGRAFAAMGEQSNAFAVRASYDKAEASAWYRWGTTSNVFDPDKKFDAEVSPFLFPECGGIPIFKALEGAKDSVYVSMYMITEPNAIACLAECAKRGVTVKLLLEGHTGGYYLDGSSDYAKMLKYLVESGAEVNILTRENESSDDLRRYYYLHTKYCIIDGETVIVTSENWDTYNFTGKTVSDPTEGSNRGWGVIVKSKDYADYMKAVFDNDNSKAYGDVFGFTHVYPGTAPMAITYTSPSDQYPIQTFATKVTPILSPDNSWDATIHYIDNTRKRIDMEMLAISEEYFDAAVESPVSHLIKKAESADVRVLICMTENRDKVIEEISYLNDNSKIKVGYMSHPYLHNKGLVFDDTALVSTVNWTATGFLTNREVGVIIHSPEVADYFAAAFDSDFEDNYDSEAERYVIETSTVLEISILGAAMIAAAAAILLIDRRSRSL